MSPYGRARFSGAWGDRPHTHRPPASATRAMKSIIHTKPAPLPLVLRTRLLAAPPLLRLQPRSLPLTGVQRPMEASWSGGPMNFQIFLFFPHALGTWSAEHRLHINSDCRSLLKWGMLGSTRWGDVGIHPLGLSRDEDKGLRLLCRTPHLYMRNTSLFLVSACQQHAFLPT